MLMDKATTTRLQDAILNIIAERGRKFIVVKTGEIFEGIMESDLAIELRDRRWRLPRSWMSDVRDAGFTSRAVYQFEGGEVRTHFDEEPRINPDTGRPFAYDSHQRRLLGRYNTIITL